MSKRKQQRRIKSDLWDQMIDAAFKHGVLFVETFVCPECKENCFSIHNDRQEIVHCSACGKRLPSQVPRAPQPGEITAGHYEAAIQFMMFKAATSHAATGEVLPKMLHEALKRLLGITEELAKMDGVTPEEVPASKE